MALDTNGKLYSWRRHCKNISLPVLVENLKEYKVDLIRCGYYNSYCRTICVKHCVWGTNDDNEYLAFDGKYNDQTLTHRIDLILKEKCSTQKIIDSNG